MRRLSRFFRWGGEKEKIWKAISSSIVLIILIGAGIFHFAAKAHQEIGLSDAERKLFFFFFIFVAINYFLTLLFYSFSQESRRLFIGTALSGVSYLIAVYFFWAISKGQSGWPVILIFAVAVIIAILGMVLLWCAKPELSGEKKEVLAAQ